MANFDRPAFVTLRLNRVRDESWAVLEASSGAVAQNDAGKLLLGLLREDAERIAADLSRGAAGTVPRVAVRGR